VSRPGRARGPRLPQESNLEACRLAGYALRATPAVARLRQKHTCKVLHPLLIPNLCCCTTTEPVWRSGSSLLEPPRPSTHDVLHLQQWFKGAIQRVAQSMMFFLGNGRTLLNRILAWKGKKCGRARKRGKIHVVRGVACKVLELLLTCLPLKLFCSPREAHATMIAFRHHRFI